ncbi:proposed peptidoglycan lipid II flippase MurJ [Geminocystis sp. NIES-3708]|uniref:murein biosynthesis integral membrane protein MurJ n=1 Tax=Geminocystis sp. NIES-3708 TaxID=1615909 RepID=UPI0005FC6106|nr:murein biosynthesis integral membrane protein MurJ [Geminocystis sp. NIES-3708]BAQ59932.1 proposed peptidoglycan lipid II flippase MurJ [Geminocystis sp. NIES-3708]
MSTNSKTKKSLAGIAGIVAVATLISKIFGLVREQIVAAAFGVGAVVNAYAYAYVIPGFLLILLGGINGPFHSSLVSVLAKRDREDAAPLIETITTLVSTILLVTTVILVIYADKFIDLLAPGLTPNVRDMAILQLQIMAPLAVFAGLIGIGFGSLNASDQYWLPSISPLFSSLTIVIGVGGLFLFLGDRINAPEYIQFGSLMLAGTTLAGGLWQWLAQQVTQIKLGISTLKLRFDWGREGVNDVMKVMAPATLSSGMLHINVYTDLYFASYLENAAAAMRYANFIVLTPLGIISNMILVPFLPVFSRLAAPDNWDELKLRIRQGLVLTALTMFPLTAIFMALSNPIVKIIYERGVFKSADSAIVAPVLLAYGVGMFFYLGRDVIVRVFYALGDGQTPFKVSIINIFINVILDYLLVKKFETQGLVFATIGVNIFSMIALIWILHKRLNGLPLKEWLFIFSGLIIATISSGFGCYWINNYLTSLWGEEGLFLQGINLLISSLISLIIFLLIIMQLKLPELQILFTKINTKFNRK